MISASLAVEGHAHGLGLPGHHHPAYHMTYPEPWRGAPPQPPPKPTTASAAASSSAEFLRPAPKQFGNTRYNGTPSSTTTLNGTRLVPQTSNSPRSSGKYSSPPCNSTTSGPVNLTQQHQIKDEATHIDDRQAHSPQSQLTPTYSPGAAAAAAAAAYSRLYPAPPGFAGLSYQSGLSGHYGGLYPTPYTPIIRTNFVQPPPLSPLETYSPPTSLVGAQSHVKPGQSVLREKRSVIGPAGPGFKVPSGKEGSLKHRILTRPPGENTSIHGIVSRKRMSSSALSPPATPTKPPLNTNNNTVPGNFTKGSLIQLASGELRRVEDMRTEDFVLSAEKCPELRLAESTVVRIEENPITGTSKITLSYNQNRTQVEFEATLEHPFFVFGQGWASCNPERTLQCYGLKYHYDYSHDHSNDGTPSIQDKCHGEYATPVGQGTVTSTGTSDHQVTGASRCEHGGVEETTLVRA
ncbi:Ataxin 1 [Carabus blaptoides fortunei]